MITRPRLTGGRGSDSKQISIDFGVRDADNALAGTPVTLGDPRSPLLRPAQGLVKADPPHHGLRLTA